MNELGEVPKKKKIKVKTESKDIVQNNSSNTTSLPLDINYKAVCIALVVLLGVFCVYNYTGIVSTIKLALFPEEVKKSVNEVSLITTRGSLTMNTSDATTTTVTSNAIVAAPPAITPVKKIIQGWPPSYIKPIGIKLIGVKQLGEGCNSITEPCWGKAIQRGTIQFVATNARITYPGFEHRKIVFAFFKNSYTLHGVTGWYNVSPFFLDDGSLAGGDITSGIAEEIDWVYGTKNGLVYHEKKADRCFETFWNTGHNVWDVRDTVCPK